MLASRPKSGAIAGGTVGGFVVLLISAIGVIIFLKKRKEAQGATSSTFPESVDGELSADKSLREMHEDSRPLKLSEQALHELNGQNLQEMEQPPQRIELHEHEPSEMQEYGSHT